MTSIPAVSKLYDTGFNPRFSFDGSYYNGAKITFIQRIRLIIQNIINNLQMIWKLRSIENRKERHFLKKLWKCIKTEEALSKFEYKRSVICKGKSYYYSHIQLMERKFFEQSSKLFHNIIGTANSKRLFPSELLKMIHYINKPEKPADNKENRHEEDWTSTTLFKLKAWGFSKLESGENPSHADFIQGVDKPGERLKEVNREWRRLLISVKKEVLNAKVSPVTQEKIKENLQNLSQAWDGLAQSHKMACDINEAFSTYDFYASYYAGLAKKTKYPWPLPLFLYGNLTQKSRQHRFEEGAILLYKYLQRHSPNFYPFTII